MNTEPTSRGDSITLPRASISFAEAFAFWLKLGFVSFGGPAGQISLMHQEPVERRRWISNRRFLHALNGWHGTLTQMGWFFTKAALLTVGGAYAVLPYVYQGAVTSYGWLTPTQMIDGLALGETTPGPLIMIVAFVGFVGGYGGQVLGPDQLFVGGAVAAALVTWFTFLPSFVFILVGGPLVETTHEDLNFTSPLTAITAAVVGVIVNLALFFGYHVLWPLGFSSSADWVAAVIAFAAAIALFRYKTNVVPVILACGLAGLIVTLSTSK